MLSSIRKIWRTSLTNKLLHSVLYDFSLQTDLQYPLSIDLPLQPIIIPIKIQRPNTPPSIQPSDLFHRNESLPTLQRHSLLIIGPIPRTQDMALTLLP